MGDLLKGIHLLPQGDFETAVENNQIDDDVIYVTPEDFSSLSREQTKQIAKNTEDIAVNKTNIENNAAAIESLKNSSGGSSEDLVEIKNTIQEIILRDISQDSRLDDIENDYATEEFVIENGGKIDKITVNGIEQIIADKTVNLVIPDTSAIEDRLAKTVNLDEAQTIIGPKTFTEHIYISNADGTVDRISHMNNNFIIHSGATNSAVLNIDEGLEKIYAFNEELAFKSDIDFDVIEFAEIEKQKSKNLFRPYEIIDESELTSGYIDLTDADYHAFLAENFYVSYPSWTSGFSAVWFRPSHSNPSRWELRCDDNKTHNIKVTNLKPNTNYTFSFTVKYCLYPMYFLNKYIAKNTATHTNEIVTTFTTDLNGEYVFTNGYTGANASNGGLCEVINIQLEEGVEKTEYTHPYGPVVHGWSSPWGMGETKSNQNDTVVEYWISSDGNVWYRKWASGWKECGTKIAGQSAGTTNVTLPIEFSVTPKVFVQSITTTTTTNDVGASFNDVIRIAGVIKTLTNSEVVISTASSSGITGGYDIYAMGY